MRKSDRGADQHVALVTGASGGIGAAVSGTLAAAGAAVLVAARDLERCERVARELELAGFRAWPLRLDVTDAESVERAVREARRLSAELGPIDWLVNNAGMAVSAPLLPKRDDLGELHRAHLEVNLHGARRLIETLAPGMKERGYGRVVNVASSAGLRGYAYASAYCASKFALVGYTLAAAEDLRDSGVTVNAVCPHYVDSPMLDAAIERLVRKTGRSADEARDFFRAENPSGELVTPDLVALAVLGLLGGEETGALLELDGSSAFRLRTPGERG